LHVNLINYKTWLINQLIYHKESIRFWPIKRYQSKHTLIMF